MIYNYTIIGLIASTQNISVYVLELLPQSDIFCYVARSGVAPSEALSNAQGLVIP